MSKNQRLRALRLSVAAMLVASTVGIGCALAEETVTFVGWGGEGQDAMKKAWTDPFEKATGIKVVHDGPTDYGKFKAMVESGNVTWDVVDVEGSFAYKAAAEGLLEPLDYSIIDQAGVDPRYVFDYGIGSNTWSWVLGYNTAVLGDAKPETWSNWSRAR